VALAELNWLGRGPIAAEGIAVAARLRSTQPPVSATLYPGATAGVAELVLAKPAGAVAPGQAAVLYDGEQVLGGGWIRRQAAGSA
jgi:tRNA-specific 2-thiouridylase